jgi:hypothetical protein
MADREGVKEDTQSAGEGSPKGGFLDEKGIREEAESIIKKASADIGLEPHDYPVMESFITESLRNLYLFGAKHRDYGERNIAEFGETGVLIRLNDKLARLKNLRGKAEANESKADTWQDISNYAIIAVLCRRKLWPGAKESDNI